jgi:UDP-N-acetylglucosamine--N-acetylmuramyl-(pentapeptide) pyrophosphoryl-undecaprenol N-acetylglucosamine transferase
MFPAEALARALLARGQRVALITDRRGGGFGPDLPEVATYAIAAGGIAGTNITKRLHSLTRLGLGYFQARRHLRAAGASAVVGFGGYPSVPSVLAGAHMGLRVVLHEQNAVLGRANRGLARYAHTICTSFDQVDALAANLKAEIAITGNPVRAAVAAVGDKPYPAAEDQAHTTLLVTGGSQGALVFNELVPAAIALLPEDLRQKLFVIQQVPGDALEAVAAAYDSCGVAHELRAFFDDLPDRLAAAQLVLCRAGASTVAELANAGRPAILVPYPSATDDHQTRNAQALCEVGGGWLMPQKSLTAESLCERLRSLLTTPALLSQAAAAAHASAHRAAAEKLADAVLRQGNGAGDVEEAA